MRDVLGAGAGDEQEGGGGETVAHQRGVIRTLSVMARLSMCRLAAVASLPEPPRAARLAGIRFETLCMFA
jgi:hypothetical protein